jgi:penicillin-binding protein 1A
MSIMARALADKPAEEFMPTEDIVSVKIDPETGLLAREGAADAITDVFRKGTEPTQYADKNGQQKSGSAQLYNVDQGGPEDTTKKKLSTDEVSD